MIVRTISTQGCMLKFGVLWLQHAPCRTWTIAWLFLFRSKMSYALVLRLHYKECDLLFPLAHLSNHSSLILFPGICWTALLLQGRSLILGLGGGGGVAPALANLLTFSFPLMLLWPQNPLQYYADGVWCYQFVDCSSFKRADFAFMWNVFQCLQDRQGVTENNFIK